MWEPIKGTCFSTKEARSNSGQCLDFRVVMVSLFFFNLSETGPGQALLLHWYVGGFSRPFPLREDSVERKPSHCIFRSSETEKARVSFIPSVNQSCPVIPESLSIKLMFSFFYSDQGFFWRHSRILTCPGFLYSVLTQLERSFLKHTSMHVTLTWTMLWTEY